MNADLKDSFSRIKPVCDVVMVCPTQESITNFVSRVADLKKEVVQELQQYLLFPFITHIKSTEIEKKFELQWKLVDGMQTVLEKVTVNSYEMCLKIETALLQLVFDNSKPGMIAEVPEELKHSVMKCLTVLILSIEKRFREKLLKTQVPLLAQAIFVSVHIAKLEKLRSLRLAAVNCVMAHTMTHPQLTDDKYRIPDATLELAAADMLASILPGVLAALQDVATCTNNPGHAVVVASLEATHRILCLAMSDRFLSKDPTITPQDFAQSFRNTVQYYNQEQETNEVSCKEPLFKDIPKRSGEWYRMASDKLIIVTKSLIALRTHEHYKVRKELAVFCTRVLTECTLTMQPSLPMVLDILITLSKDEWPDVAQYCSEAVGGYLKNASFAARLRIMDDLCDNFFVMLHGLPMVLNNIDSDRKLSALNLLHGYIQVLCDDGRPQRLTAALSAHDNMPALCAALRAAAALRRPGPRALRPAAPDVNVTVGQPVLASEEPSWLQLRDLDTPVVARRFQDICALLAQAHSAHLILDRLLDMFHRDRTTELVCIMNWMMAGSTDESFVCRILDTYLEDSVWYAPLEVNEQDDTPSETLDVTVHDPRAWTVDRVPGLYEGAVETRYTGIPYSAPRTSARRADACASAGEARRNLLRCCALVDGVGRAAGVLAGSFQRYMLAAAVKVLERAGSQYELLHQSGMRALSALAVSAGVTSAPDLIRCNADYLTHHVTVKLKKAWNTQSALEILSVIMEYSDPSLSDFLYGIVKDVLVQSCDKYYENNLEAYLQVFLSFINCVRKWFPEERDQNTSNKDNELVIDIMNDLVEYIKCSDEAERLMDAEESETDRSVEDLYNEDVRNREENLLDYDDKVTEEKAPLPQHIEVVSLVLRRCVNFVCVSNRRGATLALIVLTRGVTILRGYDDTLLPIVHLMWGPLATRLTTIEVVVSRRALQLLAALADVAGDFIHARCVKEVLPSLWSHLRSWAAASIREASLAYCSGASYALHFTALEALPALAARLGLKDSQLGEAMACATLHLSTQQPKPLQELAVSFFVAMLEYDYGATWYHLRCVCDNRATLDPPPATTLQLDPIFGTPFHTQNKHLDSNIRAIFASKEFK